MPMPVKTSLADILSIRFDFGVPLEDVFPPDDIHPRLKYLFMKAFEAHVENGFNIQKILRYNQGTLNERLTLKDKIVLGLNYNGSNLQDFSSGAYFWTIRHFLGLLPLPVFPTYTKGIQFAWDIAAEECKCLFKHHDNQNRDVLDYDIAEALNMLPLENLILLNVLIHFLRKLSTKVVGRRKKFHRPSLMVLINYFSPCLFVRPFRPGHYKNKEESYYSPLLIYLILRWKNIARYCRSIGHPAYFDLNSDWKQQDFKKQEFFRENDSYLTNKKCIRNALLLFDPDIITICKKIPYLTKYLVDSACQTETDLCINNVNCHNEDLIEPDNNKTVCNNNKVYKLAYIEEIEEEQGEEEGDGTLYLTAANEFAFNNILDEEDKHDWKKIVENTKETIKKVEESYIYDDYETFKNEDFNQVGKSRLGSFISKFSKYPAKLLVPKSSTPKNSSPESENSYIKYPDVCDSDASVHSYSSSQLDDKNRDSDEINVNDHHVIKKRAQRMMVPSGIGGIGQKLFQSSSPVSVQEDNSTAGLHQAIDNDANKKKKQRTYFIRKLRMSLDVLRTLTPKKGTFTKKIAESTSVRYRRIRSENNNNNNNKAHTI